MKKSVIKRRKRVIPASQEDDAADTAMEGVMALDSVEQASIYAESDVERGTQNEDGSVNLGFRRKSDHPSTLLPKPVRSSQGSTPLPPSTDLMAYHTTAHAPQSFYIRDSLTDDNRLAPLTSISAASNRQYSLSPASFLSPSRRKRSFSATDSDVPPNEFGQDNSKRLSSIKSILNNPATGSSGNYNASEDGESLRLRSPVSLLMPAPSPSSFSITSSMLPSMHSRETTAESERSKADRRAALHQEAERMREMLAAKERELAALGE
ncbi:Uu.00g016340.m01.CDS01 [Anthostomella pinea]|uniref:Uu.00g016340.m01.CDS01 n=1 Tax=Anthostomella pinea TaxID=933095 RepID=A0AAI8VZK9_9PEZI|nr:Uu.00g016340.m01.CDS01 [Anthostomella pinea]